MITCVVGSGGKTTYIHRLADFYRAQGKRVLITTTTHMIVESDTLVTDDPSKIIECLQREGYAFAGSRSPVKANEPEKITALSDAVFQAVRPYADEILIEADGSRQMPLKFPNEQEPVIPSDCDRIVVVTSLLPLKKPAKEVVHRLEEAQKVLKLHDLTPITPQHIQMLLRKGYLEPLMNQGYDTQIQISHDGSLYQRALAALLKADMDVSLLDPDWFRDKPRLMICGGGHVAKELADIAAFLDFKIDVLDSRSEFANRERFPQAEHVICAPFGTLSDHLEKDSFYVVVTPGHQDDYTCVKQILNSSYDYLGMIGSRRKIASVYEQLQADGFSAKQLDTIHAPIGLPIGAVTPAEIAVSILAQLIEVKNKRSASSASTELLNTDQSGTLCIITEKTGSAPRGVGSMMLVTKDGQIDTIGGGSIEHQVIQEAGKITAPCIKNFSLNLTDAASTGMVCGGTNRVLFIPV